MPSLSEFQPYLAAIGSFLNVATFGFVIRIAQVLRNIERQRAEILEDRLAGVKEDLARTEKWSDREKKELTSQNESLRSQLEELLNGSGMTIEALSGGKSLQEAQKSIQQSVDVLIQSMEKINKSSGGIDNPKWHLELAKGYMAKSEWSNAAKHFDFYVDSEPSDASAQFSRGVSYANIGGNECNINALRAYNEAITFTPATIDKDMYARYFTYRGGILKRLKRLPEAYSDLQLALSLASRKYEINDIKYNLACVYAMQGNRELMLKMVSELSGDHQKLLGIQLKINDYFANYTNDDEFLDIIYPYGSSV
ncbi:MAG: hypothetical protein GY702_28595 [Desulfobulbaceae bacterium]|nr:hypothetical protein [Desulfobulbaceae bacterium]